MHVEETVITTREKIVMLAGHTHKRDKNWTENLEQKLAIHILKKLRQKRELVQKRNEVSAC